MRTERLPSPRALVALAVVVLGSSLTVVGLAGSSTSSGPDAPVVPEQVPVAAPSVGASGPRADLRRAVRVLTGWDRARASAYSAGDARRLGALYTPGSTARAADLALLEQYAGAGVRVRDLRMQLLALEVLAAGPRRLRLRVTDRVQAAAAEGPHGPVRLAEDARSTRVVVLARHGDEGTWRVHEVLSAGRRRSGP